MTKKLLFVYPHGGGGSWLSNLIYKLEHNDLKNSSDELFDFTKKSVSVAVGHRFEYLDSSGQFLLNSYDADTDIKVFCSNRPFQLYLSEAIKVQKHLLKNITNDSGFTSDFNLLTNTAYNQITDKNFIKYYYSCVDLDYQLIFTDKHKFCDNLFSILDEYKIKYVKNRNLVFDSIENYKRTSINPDTIIGNLNNLLWVSWAHALIMIYNLKLAEPFNFVDATTISEVGKILGPLNNELIELTRSHSFMWINN